MEVAPRGEGTMGVRAGGTKRGAGNPGPEGLRRGRWTTPGTDLLASFCPSHVMVNKKCALNIQNQSRPSARPIAARREVAEGPRRLAVHGDFSFP